MQVATDDDLVTGLCMHFENMPAGAPPAPLPHPFVATIPDPGRKAVQAETEPMQDASGELPEDRPMMVYGLPCTNTGTVTKNSSTCPHVPLPPGVGWAPMPKPPKQEVGILEGPPPDPPASPAGDAVMHQGYASCCFGAGSVVRLGDPAQSCSEPARMTSTVLAVPKGGPCLVGV